MDEAPELGGEHIAADDRALVDEQAGLDAALTGGVVGDLIGVPLDALAAVVGQIEALAGLEFQVLAVGLVCSGMISSSTAMGSLETDQP